ncbi:NUDIX domain-containing protein [Streptomyces sp. NBC_00829]|uniref:NUDIX domain-containing protein n=1 Tax=Streptomyces sp. NBC_00829 TaxID=2903679 RepID=UPI00386E97FC|nr:NUDIX domain-containing protein [Streptomyces sp. NBC_00829]
MSAVPSVHVTARAVVLRNEQILLLRYDRPRPHYNLPGGKAKAHEGLADTVVRKVAEECGLRTEVRGLLFVEESLPAGRGSDPAVHHKFECVVLADVPDGAEPPGDGPPARDPHGGTPEWVPLTELTELPLLPPIQERLLAALRSPLSTGIWHRVEEPVR